MDIENNYGMLCDKLVSTNLRNNPLDIDTLKYL